MSHRFASLIVTVAIVVAIVFDQRSPSSSELGGVAPASFIAGALGCPAATIKGARGSINVANVGDGDAEVRVTWFPRKGKSEAISFGLPAGAVKQLRPKRASVRNPSSALVEFTGSEIVASHTVAAASRGAAGACVPSGPDVLAVGGLRTFRARSTLAMFNPGGGLVAVGITLFADGRRMKPASLERVEVPARSRVDVALDDFAFDTKVITALIETVTLHERGRVIVEGIVNDEAGLSIVGAVAPANSIVAPWIRRSKSDTGRELSSVVVSAVGSRGSAVTGRVLQKGRQGRASGLPPELRAGASATVRAPRSAPLAAFAFDGTSLVSTSRWVLGPQGGLDQAAVEAAPAAVRWGGVIGIPRLPAKIGVIIANPGADTVPVAVTVLGGTFRSVVLQPGTVVRLLLAQGKPIVGVRLEADAPVAVALEAAFMSARAFNIAVPGRPLEDHPPVPVRSDPRVAVPVRIRDIDG